MLIMEKKHGVEEKDIIEISSINQAQYIELQKETEKFVSSEDGQQFDATQNSVYKSIKVNKQQMLNILGQEGSVTVKDQNGNVIANLNKETETNENGVIEVNYEVEVTNAIVTTTLPVVEGNLEIYHTRAIKANNEYEKEQMRTFSKINSVSKINTSIENETAEAQIELNDTKSEAKLEVTPNNFSTLQTNENVQLSLTLLSNSEQHDLYKNSEVEIILPKEVKMDVINTVRVDEIPGITLGNIVIYENDEGNQIIHLSLQGEQSEFGNQLYSGIEIAIMGNIKIEKTVPTQDTQISVKYTNENKEGQIFETSAPITLKSKEGILLVNELNNYNKAEESVTSVDNQVKEVQIDAEAERKQTNQEIVLVNNYDTEITDLAIIGKLPQNKEEVVEDKTVKATFGMSLVSALEAENKAAKVYYSEDENATKDSGTWHEEITEMANVRAYKIELEENSLKQGENFKVSYPLEIPENIGQNESTYIDVNVDYNVNNAAMSTKSTIALKTSGVMAKVGEADEHFAKTQTVGNLRIDMNARTGDSYLQDGATVKEGQGIKYIAKVTNVGNTDITNISINTTHTNAILYEDRKETLDEDIAEALGYTEVTYYEEKEGKESEQFTIESLEPGKSTYIEYQLSVGGDVEENSNLTGKYEISADGMETAMVDNINCQIDQAKIKMLLTSAYEKETPITSNNSEYSLGLELQNLTNNDLKNIQLELKVPEQLEYNYSGIGERGQDKQEEAKAMYSDNVLKIELDSLPVGKVIDVSIILYTKEMDISKKSEDVRLYVTANVKGDEGEYVSNELERTIYQSDIEININQTANPENESTVRDGDKVVYTFTIQGEGCVEKEIEFYDKLPSGINMDKYTITRNGETKEIENNLDDIEYDKDEDFEDIEYEEDGEDIELDEELKSELDKVLDEEEESSKQDQEQEEQEKEGLTLVFEEFIIQPKETVIITIYGTVDKMYADHNTAVNYATVKGTNLSEESNYITYIIEGVETSDDDYGEEDPNNPSDPNNPNNPSNPSESETHSISGIAWIDENKDGTRDGYEPIISNMEVVLINSDTGKEESKTQTDSEGNYRFSEAKTGNYIVGFKYDTTRYAITNYQVQGVDVNKNSDVISKKVQLNGQETVMAVTKQLELKGDLGNIDAGFIQLQTFDLKLDKYIAQITIKDKVGTRVISYENTKLAKVELDAKKVADTTLIIKYQIKVTNEGDIAGYASEIVDYLPEGLKFSSELNKSWYQDSKGNIKTKELADQLIEPGQSKTIEVTVMKQMNQNNMGTITNTAEIAVDNNELAIEDKDSVPGNNADKEDDMDTAEIIVSIRTGAIIYTTLILSFVGMIIVGVYLIKKKVLKKN